MFSAIVQGKFCIFVVALYDFVDSNVQIAPAPFVPACFILVHFSSHFVVLLCAR